MGGLRVKSENSLLERVFSIICCPSQNLIGYPQKILSIRIMTTARRNNASEAEFTQKALDNPFAEGAFRYVAKGKYTKGERQGQRCVCKWFKTGSVFEESFFETDIKTSKMAIEIISRF